MINRGNIQMDLRDELKIPLDEPLPNITPVYPANNKYSGHIANATATTTGTSTVFTVPDGEMFYVTALHCSFLYDAAFDGEFFDVLIEIGNVDTVVLRAYIVAGAAGSGTMNIVFPFPVKMTGGSKVRHTTTFAAGTSKRNTSVVGYRQ